MDRIALFTTSFGGIDALKPIPRHDQIDTFFVTDTVTNPDHPAAATWTRLIDPAGASAGFPGRLRSRYYKTQIHRLPEAKPYRWLVWADASLCFNDIDFIVDEATKLAHLPAEQRLALVPHPRRKTVDEEYAHVRNQIQRGNEYLSARYQLRELSDQMEFLAAEGMATSGRLWALGFWLVENNDQIGACWDCWWDHIKRFGPMDQLPLPPLIERFRLVPSALNIDIRANRHFRRVAHQSD